MRTSTKRITCISVTRIVNCTVLMTCIALFLFGCWIAPRGPVEYTREFENELKKEFEYVRSFRMGTSFPNGVAWDCKIKKHMDVDELEELIERMKEFALCDETFQALSDTGNYDKREYMQSVSISIFLGSRVVYMTEVEKNYGEYEFSRWKLRIPKPSHPTHGSVN